MHKRQSIVITSTRARQFAQLVASALRKASIDSFGGAPSDGVLPSGPLAGSPVNISDPSDEPGSNPPYALPPVTHFPSDYVKTGDTVFEVLTEDNGVYYATHDVDFYRQVWFDGLAARISAHWSMAADGGLVPSADLLDDVRVSVKYVVA